MNSAIILMIILGTGAIIAAFFALKATPKHTKH
jgi:hypothetical protein